LQAAGGRRLIRFSGWLCRQAGPDASATSANCSAVGAAVNASNSSPEDIAVQVLARTSFSHANKSFTAALLSALCIASCVSTPPDSENFPQAAAPTVKLQPGDVLQVKFLYWPELNEEKQSIRPDGKISLQLVGDVHAQGLSPDELRTHLLDLYDEKLIEPEISVVVGALDSNRVYVGGEVLAPGMVMINGRLSVLEAIMQSGGPRKDTAKLNSVVVVRQRDGKQYGITLDLRNALESAESETFMLEPYDVVFVPQTNIDKVDQFVEQYINRIVPRALHYNFTHEMNPSSSSNDGALASQLLSNIGSAAPTVQVGGGAP